MIKRRKVVQAHVDVVNEIIDDIINGKINLSEAEVYVNQKAEEQKIEKISKDTIQDIVEEQLQDNQEKLALYKEKRRHNRGKHPNEIKEEIKQRIIQDIPKIMKQELQISNIARNYKISIKATRNIIEEYLKPNEQLYKQYKDIVKKNTGASLEQRKRAKEKRETINNKNIVTSKEFIQLPIEQQIEMIIIKFQKIKLKEVIKHGKGISDKEYVDEKVRSLIEYFMERNNEEESKGNLSEEDVLYMMYRFPGMINYSIDEKIDKTITFLEDEADLGFVNTNQILKSFPTILGYSIERTSSQIKILQENNLVDAIISTPMRFMESPELMYSLIEFAKERHKTNNLDGVNRSNIFMANTTMKRLYHTDYAEIKERFPLKENKLEHSVDEDLKEIALGENIQSQERILIETKRGVTQREQVTKIEEK